VPHLRFVEDKLVREFAARNPALKAFDDANVAASRAAATVTAQFVDRQLAHLRAQRDTETAYTMAVGEIVKDGRQVLTRALPSLRGAGVVNPDVVPPRDQFARVMAAQAALLDGALKAAAKVTDDRLRGLPPYRDFRTPAARAALAARAASTEPRMPAPDYTSSDESSAAAAAAAKPLA